jgi:hypothetical protein
VWQRGKEETCKALGYLSRNTEEVSEGASFQDTKGGNQLRREE